MHGKGDDLLHDALGHGELADDHVVTIAVGGVVEDQLGVVDAGSDAERSEPRDELVATDCPTRG